MKVKYCAIMDEVDSSTKILQNTILTIVGMHNGFAICEDAGGAKWIVPCQVLTTNGVTQ